MNYEKIILPHDDIVNDCLDSIKYEFQGLSEREFMIVLRTLDFVYAKGIKGDMQIYFAINCATVLEEHFDIKGVYFSEDDLLADIRAIKSYNYFIYSTTHSCAMQDCGESNPLLTKHTIKEFMDKLEEKERKENEEREYKEYLRLKEKFEKE